MRILRVYTWLTAIAQPYSGVSDDLPSYCRSIFPETTHNLGLSIGKSFFVEDLYVRSHQAKIVASITSCAIVHCYQDRPCGCDRRLSLISAVGYEARGTSGTRCCKEVSRRLFTDRNRSSADAQSAISITSLFRLGTVAFIKTSVHSPNLQVISSPRFGGIQRRQLSVSVHRFNVVQRLQVILDSTDPTNQSRCQLQAEF